ncbi:Dyp-type peroxidase [Vibrio rumoiensis]|uniref:Deferrochelatase n=1 Tax=Vibrio rumoiensis 1S-45 TaxID=1188252 RepID=A0A1E5E0M6_9VIBR|nr:Dyp-type peroxidase [Vibrio rumoiensis]OEF23990.1 deferrochelatase [Vibrio rumoiensis 1S-45]
MSHPQTAITPEANPFSLHCLFKIKSNHEQVLAQFKALPTLIEELNTHQAGANLVLSTAFSHQFWAKTNQSMPEELEPFVALGQGDITAPATDVDVLLHCHSTRHDLHFYVLRQLMNSIVNDVEIVDETYGYRYLDSRDMTDFVDGTENPKGNDRYDVAIIPEGEFAGGSYVMTQRFLHDIPAWNRLSVAAQEKVIGRTKPDSIELDDVPPTSHVGRVDIKEEGKGLKMVRHSLPYGSVSGEHGLFFIAYCNRLHNFKVLLNSMYGETDGKTDTLLRFTTAVTGAYFFAPSAQMLSDLSMA